MEYNIRDFVEKMRNYFYRQFPYEPDIVNEQKHILNNKNPKPKHIRDVAFMQNPVQYLTEDLVIFEIGNEESEKDYPYYHILEDAPVIRKKDKGTGKSKGSQDMVTNLGRRDYGIVSFNGKTFTKEYARNVRGKRNSVIRNSTRYIKDYNGDTIKINKGANSYQNRHYHYIENMILSSNQLLAVDFNMKQGRSVDSGLGEEYVMDNYDIKDYDYDSVSQWVSQIINM